MINWLWIALVLLTGVTKGYCGKKTSGIAGHIHDAVYISTVRFGICTLLGAIICIVQGGFASLISLNGLWVALLSGIAQAVFATTWLLAVRTGAYTMLDAFLTAGILIPSLLCHYLYGEPIKALQWTGFGVLIAAVCILCSYNNRIKSKLTLRSLGLLLVCGISSGAADFFQKLLNHHYPQMSAAVFNFYAYAFATVALGAVFLLLKPKGEKPIAVKSFGGYLAVMAVCLFLNSFFKTLAARELAAAVMYPVCQGGGLVLSAVMAASFFGEPIRRRSVLGLLLVFASLMMITFA